MAKEILPSDLFQKLNYYNSGTGRRNFYIHEFDTGYQNPSLIAPDEIFLPVNHFAVQNVYFRRYLVSNYGRVFDIFKSKFLNQSEYNKYLSVCLFCNSLNGICGSTSIFVHRLVMLVFDYNPNNMYLEVNHLNGNHYDNRLCNLEWCTPAQNKQYAVANRQMASGENAPTTVVTKEQAIEICERLEKGERLVDIADAVGVNYDRVKDIKRGVSWRYLSKDYNIPETKHYKNDLDEATALIIAKRLENGERVKDIANSTGISYSVIQSIKTRETFKELTKNMYLGEVKEFHILTEDQVRRICELLQEKREVKEIITIMKQEFGIDVPDTKIWRIRRRVQNQEISKDYVW